MMDLLEYIGFFWFFYITNNNKNNRATVERQDVFFCVWGLFNQPVERYQIIFDHLIKISKRKSEIKEFRNVILPIQAPHSNYIAHYLIQKNEQKSVRLFRFVCFPTTKELRRHRFGFVLQ